MEGFERVSADEWQRKHAPGGTFAAALAAYLLEQEARSVGVAGAVAAGKSTLTNALAGALAARGVRVEQVGTDGFLHPNAVLEAAGLVHRKGFPESFDSSALDAFLSAVRQTGTGIVPLYSHAVYDVVGQRRLAPHQVLLVEGVNVLQSAAGSLHHLDVSIYVDANEAVLVEWFVARFIAFCAQAVDDPNSFYHQFVGLDNDEAQVFAARIWESINGVNLAAHILPSRANADLVIEKRAGHEIVAVCVRATKRS